jgi:hypothetical protein
MTDPMSRLTKSDLVKDVVIALLNAHVADPDGSHHPPVGPA